MFKIKNYNGTYSMVDVVGYENEFALVKEGTLSYYVYTSDLIKIEENKPEEKQQKETYQMTPIQYHNYVISATMKKYKCTRKRAEYCHTKEQTDRKHLEILIAAIKEGKIIPVKVLDKLTDGQRYRLTHDYPNYFDENPYFSPDVRNKKTKTWFTAS